MLPTLYKYLKREYARRMMTEGEVYIGTLAYYRGIEDAARADLNEGKKDSVTAFPEGAVVTRPEEWQRHLNALERSNIHYVSGTIQIDKGTRFVGKEDVQDAYIYCTSKVYSRRLMENFGTDSCVEISDAQRLIDAIDRQLSDLGLIYSGRSYPGISSGGNIKYAGHAVDSKTRISGNWLKDAQYTREAEFRFTFVPIIKRAGKIVDPVCRQMDGVTEFEFPNTQDIEIDAQPLVIRCKEVIECCRWRE